MKLFIDDIRTPPDDSWNVCRSVTAAIRAIDMFGSQITEIVLDHDISHQVVVGKMSRPYPCEETFEAVARFMLRFAESQDEIGVHFSPIVHIRTSNPAGMQRIKEILGTTYFKVDAEQVRAANRLENTL